MSPATRDRLIDAAQAAFANQGVAGTPITELEDAAGLAPGSGGFYRYFRTKDEVLAAVVHREIDRVRSLQEDAPVAADPSDPRAGVAASLTAMLDVLHTLRPLMAILAREQGRIPALAEEVADQMLEAGMRHDAGRLSRFIGERPDDQLRAIGAIVISALVGYTLTVDYFGRTPASVDPERFVATLTDLLASTPSAAADPAPRPSAAT